ncbi:hypothetical protein BH11MYX3_BH11MYX3_05110 [soil metagenome]
MRLGLLLLIGVSVGCGSSTPVGAIRFHNAAPVWRVNDKVPQDQEPSERGFWRNLYKLDGAFARRTTRALDLRADKPALDINAVDEVPDSTWFTNRIGMREMSIDELKRGPNVSPSPFDHRPWTITGAKVGGRSLGFTFEDGLQRKFLLKFDTLDLPEAETAAHIIGHRLIWAMGYNVPEDRVGYIHRADLVIGPKARKNGFDEARLDAALKTVNQGDDGSIRVLASMFVPGKPIGPYSREGVRRDDKNDLIPHERRRSVRGQYSIFAWLDHTDVKEDNTLDTFEDGFVHHYLIDFGKAFGVMGTFEKDPSNGHRFLLDVPSALKDLVMFGFRRHPWEGMKQPPIRGIGLYDNEHYDPGTWSSQLPYWPLLDADRFDKFWGAKILMRFKPHEIAAIVDEAQFSDPAAKRYMIDTLLLRQRATGRYWFDRVAPLDRFTAESTARGARVCFIDLMLSYLLRTSPTTYAIDTYDRHGTRIGDVQTVHAGARGLTCTNAPLATDADGYTILRLRVQRDLREMPPVVVHIARAAGGRLEIIGLRRR